MVGQPQEECSAVSFCALMNPIFTVTVVEARWIQPLALLLKNGFKSLDYYSQLVCCRVREKLCMLVC